jgi:GLPGLI family protein
MKKYILIAILFSTFQIFAQKDFQGMVVYESKTSTGDFKMGNSRDMTPEMQKMIDERMKKFSEKTFMLYFDRTASIYEEEEKLEAPGASAGGGMRWMSSFAGGGGKLYKNVKTKSFSIDKEMMGKEFLVNDSLPVLKWKIESESKKIGNYTCFKATCVQPVSKSDFRNMTRKADADAKTDKPKSTNFMDQMEMPKEVVVTAWYTPEIPINQGPEKYWGLPGLILEVNNGKTTILCSKVVMNNKEKKVITAPIKGKVVSQSEYDEIVVNKMQEMREMYQGQGRGQGGGFQMGRGRNQ